MAQTRSDGPRGGGSPYALVGLGFEIAVPAVLLMFAGHKLDGWLDSGPWLFLMGAFLGLAVGFYNLFRRVQALGRKSGERGE